ncbi:hypothetical protein [Blastococcus tunisiensis]|uniref:Uncharacterized protein n=1 Tax=Blastococcus tunisiensis TaxID=1798228 RepID=A0A1I2JF03_9ACTN|nr:hypothetical protein [Blastococcus sp. DSM 46838]SFF53134.1 hypothetical protein SAMN05216574_11617 [Blastococcus sp. DSM 46838]
MSAETRAGGSGGPSGPERPSVVAARQLAEEARQRRYQPRSRLPPRLRRSRRFQALASVAR